MRRGAPDNPWGNPRPENWINHGPRFARVNPRPNFHGYNQRSSGPRHWRPDGIFRPRNPGWNGNNYKSQMRHPINDGPMRSSCPSPIRFPFMKMPSTSTTSPQNSQKDLYALRCDQNLHDTINTVKQKLRERTKSIDYQAEPQSHGSPIDDSHSYKSAERRRIEHSKVPKSISSKKMEKRVESSKPKHNNHTMSDICERKTEIMRRKILKQLFKLDTGKLRNILNHESSSKYEVILNSLFKETRDAISRDIRNAAEKSLQDNSKTHCEDDKVVQDEFLGHLGTMLDTDATLELSSMEPQIIAQLSKVLQQDLMGPLNDNNSVMSLANAMSDDFCTDYQFPNQGSNALHSEYSQEDVDMKNGDFKREYYVRDGESKYYEDRYDNYNEFHNEGNSYHDQQQYDSIEEDYYSYHPHENHRDNNMRNSFPFNNMPSLYSGSVSHSNDYAHSSRNNFKGDYPNVAQDVNTSHNSFYSRSSQNNFKGDYPPVAQDIASKNSFHVENVSPNESNLNKVKANDNNGVLESKPDLPVHDEDLRFILPPILNNMTCPNPLMNSPKKLDDHKSNQPEENDVGSKSTCETKKESDNSMKDDKNAMKMSSTFDSNIAIRKDLFSKETDNKDEEESVESIVTVEGSTQICAAKNTKTQGTQYHMKKNDASTQIYESLFASKSKGTQTLRDNLRDKFCQTLKIDGLSGLTFNNNTERSVDAEAQTEDSPKSAKVATKDVEVSCNIIDGTEVPKTVNSYSNSESVLERMKEIDKQILALTNEKMNLYNYLKISTLDTADVVKKPEAVNTAYHIPIIRNKLRSESETSKRHSDKQSGSMSKSGDARINRSRDRMSNSLKEESRSGKTSLSKHKPNSHTDSSKSQQRNPSVQTTRSHSRQSVREDDLVKIDRHKSKRKKPQSAVDAKTFPYSVVPCKDINNCDKVDGSLNVGAAETVLAEIDNSFESRYVDPSGCPVPVDCEVVVSEEVVINSESDRASVAEDSKLTQNLCIGRRKRSDVKRNRRSSSSSSNSRNVKSDCDMLVIKNNGVPHGGKTIPPLKIKKRTIVSGKDAKVSPLYNLISQMGGSDVDKETPKPSVTSKRRKTSESNGLDANHNLSVQENNSQSNSVKILDCIVQLERIDVTKINQSNILKASDKFCNMPSTSSFVDDLDPTILHDDTLFSSKNYENDDDCILQSEQFGSFCDTDPSLIENIEVDEAFNIMDQWDTKLFENVGLLEEREILQDKNLLESLSHTESSGKDDDVEVPLKAPLYFTDHMEPIIALECIGNKFLAAAQDGVVYYYDGIQGKLLRSIKVCEVPVTSVMLKGRREPYFYTGSHDGILRCFNYENGKKVLEDVPIQCGAIQCMFQEWKTIYIGTQTGFVVQFDIVTSTLLSDSTIQFADNTILALHAMKEGPRKVLLIASRFQEVTVKDAATGLLLRTFHGPNNTVYSLCFDSGKIYCGTSGPNVQIFDFASGDMVGVYNGGRGAVCLQVYHNLVFTGCYDGFIYVYAKSEQPVAKIKGPGVMLLAMTIVKNKIIAGCKDKKLAIIPIPPDVLKLLDL